MVIRNIIFDLDGTLVDTGRDITEALNHAIKPVGLPPLEIPAVTALVGGGIPNLIMKGLGEANEHLADETRQRFVDYYETHLTDHTIPYPGVMETLDKLKSRGFTMCVLSNKNAGMSEEILRRLEMLDYFEFVIGGDTADEKKPKPGGVIQSLKKLGASADESVLVGDSSFDIEAAHTAGMRCVAVAYGFRPRTTLLDADVLIDRFTDLPAAIKGLDRTL